MALNNNHTMRRLKLYIYIDIIHVRTLLVFIVQRQKTQHKLCQKSRNNSRSIHFLMVSSVKSALILLPFLIVDQHESGTRRIIPICNKYGVSSNIVEGEHKFVSSII